MENAQGGLCPYNESLILIDVSTSIPTPRNYKNKTGSPIIFIKIKILTIKTKVNADIKWTDRAGRIE